MTLGEGRTLGWGSGQWLGGGWPLGAHTHSLPLPGIIACFQGRACACHILDFILFSEFGLSWRDPGPEARDESWHHSLLCILRQRPPPLWAPVPHMGDGGNASPCCRG